jgi:hypothetical protein
MRIEIEKKKENHAFYLVGDRKKREKKETIVNLTTIRCHMSHHVKEDTVTHSRRR